MNQRLKLQFTSADKEEWIRKVSGVEADIKSHNFTEGDRMPILISKDIGRETLAPCHFVLLGCLLELAYRSGLYPKISASDDMISFLRDDLKLHHYFDAHHAPNVVPVSSFHSNLWKISSDYAFMYSHNLQEYLQKTYFTGRDLSPLKIVLDELYSNISDHSQSDDIAFSYVKYDMAKRDILVAFCDFGIGIPASLRNSGITGRYEWIKYAIEKGVTAKSTLHNRGFGLDTVMSNIPDGGILRIISGTEFFHCSPSKSYRTYFLNYSFGGTLIYFEIPIDSFESFDESNYLCNFQTI